VEVGFRYDIDCSRTLRSATSAVARSGPAVSRLWPMHRVSGTWTGVPTPIPQRPPLPSEHGSIATGKAVPAAVLTRPVPVVCCRRDIPSENTTPGTSAGDHHARHPLRKPRNGFSPRPDVRAGIERESVLRSCGHSLLRAGSDPQALRMVTP